MIVHIDPAPLCGKLSAIVSKSHVHRLLICAALSQAKSLLPCPVFSQDIAATVRCLQGLGAQIQAGENACAIKPISYMPDAATLDCGESGSTYRFLAPVACALGKPATFHLAGKLPQRPMDPLWSVLEAHGAKITGKGSSSPSISGQLTAGRYTIAGNISSQFLSGLLFALPLLPGDSQLEITGGMQSRGYLQMTLDALREFSITIYPEKYGFAIPGKQVYQPPARLSPEGDWSNAAFWLCAAAARGCGITLTGLRHDTLQGDRAICHILQEFGAHVVCHGDSVTVSPSALHSIRLDAGDIPDLVPAIAVAAAAANGTTVIENVGRLRMKESDRVATVCATIRALGGQAEATKDTMQIHGTGRLRGGTIDGHNDHRIVMLAATASVLCDQTVTISGAQAVNKSYPKFFEDFAALGGVVAKGETPL